MLITRVGNMQNPISYSETYNYCSVSHLPSYPSHPAVPRHPWPMLLLPASGDPCSSEISFLSFHTEVRTCSSFLSVLTQCPPASFLLLQTTRLHPFLWLSTIPLHRGNHMLFIHSSTSGAPRSTPHPGCVSSATINTGVQASRGHSGFLSFGYKNPQCDCWTVQQFWF